MQPTSLLHHAPECVALGRCGARFHGLIHGASNAIGFTLLARTRPNRIAAQTDKASVSQFPILHVVAVVAGVRRVKRWLAVLDVVPPGKPLDTEQTGWWRIDGFNSRVRLQIEIGRSLLLPEGERMSTVVKQFRFRQLLYVAGRLQVETEGALSLQHADEAPSVLPQTIQHRSMEHPGQTVEKGVHGASVRLVAHHARVLEEVHWASPVESAAVSVSTNKPLQFPLPAQAVVVVDNSTELERLEVILRERMTCSGDLKVDMKISKEVSSVVAVVGLSVQKRLRSPDGLSDVALLCLAFRRSVWLLDLMALQTEDDNLRARAAQVVRNSILAPELFKVGFNIKEVLSDFVGAFPHVFAAEESVRSAVDVQTLAAPAMPSNRLQRSLTDLCFELFGHELNEVEAASDWQTRPLRPAQVLHAAQQAHVCVRLFDELCYQQPAWSTQPLRRALQELETPAIVGDVCAKTKVLTEPQREIMSSSSTARRFLSA